MKILTWPVVAGAALGIVAPLLTYNGNPGMRRVSYAIPPVH